MIEYGYLIISIDVIKYYPDGRIQKILRQVNKIFCDRNEAKKLMTQHRQESSLSINGQQQYIYQWQADREDWTNE